MVIGAARGGTPSKSKSYHATVRKRETEKEEEVISPCSCRVTLLAGSPNLRPGSSHGASELVGTRSERENSRGGADNRGRKGASELSGAGAGRVRGDSAMTDARVRHLITAHTTHGPIMPMQSPPRVGGRRKNTSFWWKWKVKRINQRAPSQIFQIAEKKTGRRSR
jgi:hypothetical protein